MESDFERLLADGTFKNSPEFINNNDNLHRVVSYLERIKPSPEVMDTLLGLLRFFRFPLALCCAVLYRRLTSAFEADFESCRQRVLEIAAYVKSLAVEMEVGLFPEIEFFMKWGQAKKKFKVNVTEREKKFGQCILQLSQIKKELAGGKLSRQEVQQKINIFLSVSFPAANVFEEKSIELMKSTAKDIIDECMFRLHDPPHKADHAAKRKEARSTERKYVEEKPKRSESIPVHHEVIPNVEFSSISEYPNGQPQPICCRTSFMVNEVIDQPESLRIEYKYYVFPFINNKGEIPTKQDKIKRTICGFLNAEGGIIYFGIKELTDSRQRLINGTILSQSQKKDFKDYITRLGAEILPDVGKKWSIKFVPVKNSKGDYITGSYIIKVIVERGSSDQVYSYLQRNLDGTFNERFAFKTENEVLQISEIQRVLKIFKNKVQSPEKTYYPVHPHPCPEPEVGKLFYQEKKKYDQDYVYDDSYEYEQSRNQQRSRFDGRRESNNRSKKSYDQPWPQEKMREDDFPTILNDDNYENWQDEEDAARRNKYLPKIKYMQKDTDEFLVASKLEDIEIILRREGIRHQLICELPSDKPWTYIKLMRVEDKKNLITVQGEVEYVYPRISYKNLQKDQLEVMESIIAQSKKEWMGVSRERGDIILFNSSVPACKFYLKMREMGLKVEFTPLI